MFQHKRYIARHYWLVCARAAENMGCNPQQLLQRSNLDLSLAADERLLTPYELQCLIQQLWQLSGNDEYMGMSRDFCQQGQFALMLEYAANSQTLGAMLRRSAKFYLINQPQLQVALEPLANDNLRLIVQLKQPAHDFAHMLQEFLLLSWLRCSSWLVGQALPVHNTCFNYPKPKHASEYKYMFAGELKFNQKHCALVLKGSCLQLPIIRSAEQVKAFLRQMPAEIFRYPVVDDSIAAQLRLILQKQDYAQFSSLEQLAAQLYLSPRTLRRKLQQENASLRTIKDQLKQQLASSLLASENISVSEVASRLGFSEVAAFCRAFKRWTGDAPTHWQAKFAEQ